MFIHLPLVMLFMCYVQYICAKKYEDRGKEVIAGVKQSQTSWTAGNSAFFIGKDEEEVAKFAGVNKDFKTHGPKKDKANKPSGQQLGTNGRGKGGRNFKPTASPNIITTTTTGGPNLVSLPESLDWRDLTSCPSVRQIRTQKCGNCWAVSSAAAISDRYCIQTGQSKYFSAKQLTTCTMPNDRDGGCNGGYPSDAMQYYMKNGVASGGDPTVPEEPRGCLAYPFKWNIPTACPTKCDDRSALDLSKAGDWMQITNRNVNSIMSEIKEYGPVVANYELFEDFNYYKSGVYQHVYGKSVGFHAVRIIGWGSENGIPYWLCANQWGTDWGENGTFKILRGQNSCGIEDWISSAYPAEGYSHTK